MFKIDLVPLVLGDLCLCRKTIQKYQISSTRSNWSKAGPPWATWWGSADPTWHRPTWHHQCHLNNLWEWLWNTLPSSLHHWSQVGAWSRVQKRLHMDSWTHHVYVGAQMDKGDSYPHSTTPPEAPHQRGSAHSSMGSWPTPCTVAWWSTSTKPTHFCSRARRHQMEQCGASVWGGSLAVWSKDKEGMSHGLMTWQ
jgi:hypothetical protein